MQTNIVLREILLNHFTLNFSRTRKQPQSGNSLHNLYYYWPIGSGYDGYYFSLYGVQ